MLTKRTFLIALPGFVLGGLIAPGEARAWHYGMPHERHHGGDEEIVIHRRQGGSYLDEGHHRPRHHRHCREVEYHDHHGRHRIKTICE